MKLVMIESELFTEVFEALKLSLYTQKASNEMA